MRFKRGQLGGFLGFPLTDETGTPETGSDVSFISRVARSNGLRIPEPTRRTGTFVNVGPRWAGKELPAQPDIG
jgi:hypothetical protein